jgi:hypothetical protein
VTARKEVERGRLRAANRALTNARWNELPRGPFLPSLARDLNQTLICPSHSEDEPSLSLDTASAQGCAAQRSGGQFTILKEGGQFTILKERD